MTKRISKWILIRTFVLTAVVCSLLTRVNTGGMDSNRGEIESENGRRTSELALNGEASKTLPNNPAEMKFSYERRKGFRGSASKRSILVTERAVYTIVEELKKRIAFPFEIKVIFKQCGGPDSFYDEDSHEIVTAQVDGHKRGRSSRRNAARQVSAGPSSPSAHPFPVPPATLNERAPSIAIGPTKD